MSQDIKFSPEIEKFIIKLESFGEKTELDEEKSKIHINMTTGRVALLYEKIRNTISYQDEQMLRRLAISRIIARRAIFDKDENTIASGLVWELIQSGYLNNDEVPEEKITEIVVCLRKYRSVEKILPEKWKQYFFGILGMELEEILINYKKDEELIHIFHSIILRHLFEPNESTNYQKISDSLYYSLIQLFLKVDKAALRYQSLKYKIPQWENLDAHKISQNKKDIQDKIQQIEDCLSLMPNSRFPKIAKRYYPLYIIIHEIIHKQPTRVREILSSKQKLTININQITSNYFQDTIAKLNRSILKAVLFIFSTKVVLGLILEIPYDRFVHGFINYQPLIINILFPPLLMFISVSMISVPGAENTKKIVEIAKKFIYDEGLNEKERKKYNYILSRTNTLQNLLTIFYIISFFITIFGLTWLLTILKFNLLSGILFFFFLSVVSFLAFRIRKSATGLTIVGEKESAFVTILDFLLLPFLKIGLWLSKKFEKANILVLIFDFILEAPFKTVLEAIEHWIAFMKEKKDEIIS